ncbi:RAMP superfamily CRISPR-associated protein [Metalysinibacillus jejuensis]|uniref:RAMP superfamily CRISPR-associated protein n=1 Tax=Metalysinibacillus jejuensis TaxID=914327 RepID=UPI000D38C6F1|nr:RAMP superfamily CRISPR-associated protein [Metalysinibacillus jejuensis]
MQIVKRTYYNITGQLASPLHIGSGHDTNTTMDVMRNYKGEPFMPGTALAGALRHWLGNNSELFGAAMAAENDFRQSRIFVSDVTFADCNVVVRDHVKLDNKVAQPQAKFTVEVLPTGTSFTMRFEIIAREKDKQPDDASAMQKLLTALYSGELTLGGKTSRGYGKVKLTQVEKQVFDYPRDSLVWLDWDWDRFEKVELPSITTQMSYLSLELAIKDTLVIRDVRQTEYAHSPLQMGGTPVIPGTTWAGAFRQRLTTILQQLPSANTSVVQQLFGDKHGDGSASLLRFEESSIVDSTFIKYTRNAIDRFSGATMDGALFTGESLCGGNTTLTIRWHKTELLDCDVIRGLLYWVIRDMNEGLLAIGGETAIGRGLLTVKTALEDEVKYCKAAMDYMKGARVNEARSD